MELDSARRTADQQGFTTRVDGVRYFLALYGKFLMLDLRDKLWIVHIAGHQ